jgi:hypothetical protein
MQRVSNHQIALKPQDLMALLKLADLRGEPESYERLAASLGMSPSEVHASVARAKAARLIQMEGSRPLVIRSALRDFILHGAKYAFPATVGAMTRGVPTSYAAPPLVSQLSQPSGEPPPVWPDPQGERRGLAFYPLYPSAPDAARKDPSLYESLALFDALRGGSARERQLASKLLAERLG